MKTRAFWMLGLAVLLAGLAVVLAQYTMQGQSAPTADAGEPAKTVVVAKTELDFGAIIRKEHLRVIVWPANSVPAGTFSSIDELIREGDRRVALRRIEVDEPVLKAKVSGFGGRATLSAVIAKDMRAATVRVNDVNGVAGFILPGDRVDVLITRDARSGKIRKRGRVNQELVTSILLQNVKVLAVDQQADESKDKPTVAKAVTLEVTSLQAQKLVLAQQVGTLSLALRNVNNSVAEKTRAVRLRDLYVGEANVARTNVKTTARRRTARRKSSVKIFRALKSSKYNVPREIRTFAPPVYSKPPKPASKTQAGKTEAPTKDAGTAARDDKDRPGSQEPATSGPVPLYKNTNRGTTTPEQQATAAPVTAPPAPVE